MPANADDQMRVAFPANARFAPVGRVATAGLALRLGIDVGQVENLRLAVSTAIAALNGGGEVTLTASWDDRQLHIELTNPDASGLTADTNEPIDPAVLAGELATLVSNVSVAATHIELDVG